MSEGASPRRLPRKAALYKQAVPRYLQIQHVAYGTFIGLCLGFMDAQDLEALNDDFYSTHAEQTGAERLQYVDERQIRSGLTDWERTALERHFVPGTDVVVTGAGSGREVLGLIALGLRPVGYEPHAGLVATGNAVLESDGHPGLLRTSARTGFPHAAPAGGVLVGWGSYSHITPRSARVAFLRGARQTLSPGDPLLVSYWSLPERERYLRVVHEASRAVRRARGAPSTERGDLLAPQFLHAFTSEEVASELVEGGFRVEEQAAEPYPHTVARAV